MSLGIKSEYYCWWVHPERGNRNVGIMHVMKKNLINNVTLIMELADGIVS